MKHQSATPLPVFLIHGRQTRGIKMAPLKKPEILFGIIILCTIISRTVTIFLTTVNKHTVTSCQLIRFSLIRESHMTEVTCSSVALSDKAKYRWIRL